MPLRHGNRPPPRWLQVCAGPFMTFMGVAGAAMIVLDGPLGFGDAVGLVLCLFLACAGVSLTNDTFFRKD